MTLQARDIPLFFRDSFYKIPRHNKSISVTVYVILATLIVDTIINQNSDILVSYTTSPFGITLFIVMAIIAVVGQYFILEFVKEKSHDVRSKVSRLNILYKIAAFVQYLLIAILVFIVLEMVLFSQYTSINLAIVTAMSYGLNIGLMAIFAQLFFSWYKSNRSSIVVLLYALSFAVVVITSCAFLFGSVYRIMEKPITIFPESEVIFPQSEEGSLLYKIGKLYHYSDIVSFILKWIATAFLLFHYSKKIGQIKYWVLVSIPLIYFLGTFLDDFHIYEPHSDSELFYWYTYGSLNSTAGGILFGIGFLVGAKHFHEKSAIKNYMMISGFGFMLFFSAGQSTLAIAPYPPYGIVTMSFYGLSSFLILLGLYSSAISVSQDIELRKSIKKSTMREARFLDSMGTAHMEKELMKRMVLKAREEQKELVQESGGVTPSLNEEDIINIVKETEKDVKEK